MRVEQSNFPKVLLSELVEINVGKTPPRKNPENFGGKYPWISISDMGESKFISETKEKISEKGLKASNIKPVQSNTLIFSFKLSIGKVAITKDEMYTNEAIAAFPIKNKSKLDLNYFYYVMSSFNFADAGVRAVMGKTLNKAKLAKLKIPLPPLPVQRRIAAILDAADEHRRKTEALIEKYDELAQSVFLEMFGDPVRNEKGWKKTQINKLCDFKKTSIGPNEIRPGMKYLGLEGIEKNTGEITKVQDLKKNQIKSNKFIFTQEHILYGKLRPYLNKVTIPHFNGICSTDIIPLKPYNKISQEFILYFLRGPWFVAFAQERSSGANLPRISPKEIEKFKIINPPIETQERFSTQIKIIKKLKKAALREFEYSETLFQSLLQRAFRGELVTEEEVVE